MPYRGVAAGRVLLAGYRGTLDNFAGVLNIFRASPETSNAADKNKSESEKQNIQKKNAHINANRNIPCEKMNGKYEKRWKVGKKIGKNKLKSEETN